MNNLKHAAVPSALFLVLNLPQLYGKTNEYLGSNSGNCPGVKTRLLHTIAFFALTYLVAKYYGDNRDQKSMVRYAVHSALMYFVLSSPAVYSLTESVLGRADSYINTGVSSGLGGNCPALKGVVVHTAVFGLFLMWAKTLN